MSELDLNVIESWWNGLKEDKGGRAELRRAHGPTEVVFLPAYHQLYGKLESLNFNKEALACVAGICAHVKENRQGKLAEQMANEISSLRFRKLLAISDRGELYYMMIRVVRHLDGAVNVADLAKTVYWWNDKTKKDLAYAYYSKESAKNKEEGDE